jgi:hypothetical protein
VERETLCDIRDVAAKSRMNKVFWPQDLLPFEIPGTRNLACGYDADVIKRDDHVKASNFTTHGQNLLFQPQREISNQASLCYNAFYTSLCLFLDSDYILRSQLRRYQSERCEIHHLGCQSH